MVIRGYGWFCAGYEWFLAGYGWFWVVMCWLLGGYGVQSRQRMILSLGGVTNYFIKILCMMLEGMLATPHVVQS